MERFKNAFEICTVRNATKKEEKFAMVYTKHLETHGYIVHWPPRNTNQNDPVGLRICQDNRLAIINAEEIHVIWKSNDYSLWQKFLAWIINKLQKLGHLHKSEGSYFDFGMAFMAQHFMPEKKIILANPYSVKQTSGKSFENVLHKLNERGRQ